MLKKTQGVGPIRKVALVKEDHEGLGISITVRTCFTFLLKNNYLQVKRMPNLDPNTQTLKKILGNRPKLRDRTKATNQCSVLRQRDKKEIRQSVDSWKGIV